MTLFLNVELEGTTEILSQLGQIDRTFQTAALKELTTALNPMVQGAQQFFPLNPPLSGLGRGQKFRYDGQRVRTSVSGSINAKGRDGRIASIRVSDQMGILFDIAGKGYGQSVKGRQLAQSLTTRHGPPSRAMWRAKAVYFRLTEHALIEASKKMAADLNRLLGG